MVHARVEFWFTASLTCRVKVKAPAEIGVPASVPVELLSASPAGSCPVADQV